MAFPMANLSDGELQQVGAALGKPEELGNSGDIELRWAVKAMEHATVHFNLISSVDASCLRLTKVDDTIYRRFREEFPDLNVANLTEDDLKRPEAKQKWRNFCESFKEEVEDYNQGTLLRLNCEGEYTEENSTLSVRTQFLAIEIARNKEGHNSSLVTKKQLKTDNKQTGKEEPLQAETRNS